MHHSLLSKTKFGHDGVNWVVYEPVYEENAYLGGKIGLAALTKYSL